MDVSLKEMTIQDQTGVKKRLEHLLSSWESLIRFSWIHGRQESPWLRVSARPGPEGWLCPSLVLEPWRRQWHPTPILLPGKSHGWRSLVGYSPWGRQESETTVRLHFHALEKEVATHSSVLAWRIPGTVEPGGLPSMGSHRVGHD